MYYQYFYDQMYAVFLRLRIAYEMITLDIIDVKLFLNETFKTLLMDQSPLQGLKSQQSEES